ncbi:uncharacterized protein KY384_006808 [Bacidia gigantensis]|uniref:uncharacterized protein n=1 Tax=Bacidia gigantensis TaxID=2732470 RepID=UPI001D039129|nr:uncharacterized protein KY384_006808 [Bacidia gigantensis]KAG8527892.1 hypothetical protein KY384_006808 [Bacidia gigantensis]
MSIKAPGLRPLVSAAEVHTREDAPHRVVDVAMGDYFMGSQAENVALGAVRLDGAAPNLTPEQLLNAKLHVKAYGVVGTRALAQYDLAPLATGLNADSYAIYAAGEYSG